MNKIEKILKKLTKKEQDMFILLINQVKKDFRKVPGIKKIIGKKNWYRVRLGNYRIVFEISNKNSINVRRISKRDEQTYKNLD